MRRPSLDRARQSLRRLSLDRARQSLRRPSLDRARQSLRRLPLDRTRPASGRRPLAGTWPVLPLLLLAVAVVVAMIGIAAAPRPTDARRIGETVRSFAGALQERRGEDACALLTPTAQQAAAARTGTLSCAATVRSFGLGVDAGPLRAARVVGVTVLGDRATVAREQLLVPDGEPFGAAITLERIDGLWRIAALM